MIALTVVIPTFNRVDILKATMSSCLEFSAGLPVDFIIVDDGSSDRTAVYLQELAETNANVRGISIANAGPGNARNVGAQQAMGDIILFMGDDTRPTSAEFFRCHLRLHERFPEKTLGVLGKIIWPERRGYSVSRVMSLIQGEGGQQFGYAHMRPYARYDWRFFYTANVSLKRSCVSNWMEDGFSTAFRSYGFEDGELAYRLGKRLGSFQVLYAPSALAEHDHRYNADAFINRQFAAGMMANVIVEKHPETAPFVGVADLATAMRRPTDAADVADEADFLSVIEGILASVRLLDRADRLGDSAWHDAFVNAAFELAYNRGVIWGFADQNADRAAGYRFALDLFDKRMARALESQALPAVVPLSFGRRYSTPAVPPPVMAASSALFERVKRRLRTQLSQYATARRVYRWLKS